MFLEYMAELLSKMICLGPRSYQCSECGFSNSYKNSMINHIEARHSDGVYQCSLCEKQCNSKHSLNMHMRRTHFFSS